MFLKFVTDVTLLDDSAVLKQQLLKVIERLQQVRPSIKVIKRLQQVRPSIRVIERLQQVRPPIRVIKRLQQVRPSIASKFDVI